MPQMVLAKQIQISKVLMREERLRVPLYQRQYQWKRQQWEELWTDIARLAMDRRATSRETHFLGSLVFATPPESEDGFLIVDGQQRLLTFGILLCALRDGEVVLPKATLERIDRSLFLSSKRKVQFLHDVVKVLPTQSDRDAYMRILFREPRAQNHLITDAYSHFEKRILQLQSDKAEGDEDFSGLSVANVAHAALHGLECVAITTQPEDNAHRIFESLNNKGTSLTQADLIRNYIFMRLDEKTEKFYEFTWRPLESRFENPDHFTQLFWLDLILNGRNATQRQTYVEQQKKMNQMTPAQIKANIKRISALANLWELILHPELEKSARIRRRLQRIQDWGTTTAAPTLMYLLDQWQSGEATWRQVEQAMTYLESYFVRRVVIGRATMNMNRVLMAAPVQLAKDRRPVDEALRAHLSGEGKHWASDKELRDIATTARFYNHGRAHQKTLILRWIEEGLRDHEDVLDPDLTVEHVMPQTLNQAWLVELKRGARPGQSARSLHEQLLHTIGNLTLTKRNTEQSNHPFEAKKAILKSRGSGMKLTAEITSKDHWGPDEIRKRGKHMIERIITNWPGPISLEED